MARHIGGNNNDRLTSSGFRAVFFQISEQVDLLHPLVNYIIENVEDVPLVLSAGSKSNTKLSATSNLLYIKDFSVICGPLSGSGRQDGGGVNQFRERRQRRRETC
jgi:hypothetical protein